MRIPLHISPSDQSQQADLARLEHYQRMSVLSRGNGFRYPSGKKNKKHVKTRSEKIGERLVNGAEE